MTAAAQKALVFHQSGFDPAKLLKQGKNEITPHYVTDLGALFSDDCMNILPRIQDESVDTIFADPPFNLNKEYGSKSNDNRTDEEYLSWCYQWIDECTRIIKPGGSFFLYNLPKWNVMLGAHMAQQGLTFRHWIAIAICSTMPLPGRLYPAHYSMLYYSKGKPKTFRKIRTPIEVCRHCGGEVRDYGGHRDTMNPKGVNLKDVWTDITPVQHWKFKSKDRRANALSTKILDRVIEMSTQPGDLVLDPFGGSGTTFAVCEAKHRHWLGVEIDFADVIADRLENATIQHHKNSDHVED